MRAILVYLLIFGAPAMAGDGLPEHTSPALYRAKEGEPLAVRRAPAPDAPLLGHIEGGDGPVEIVVSNGAWGMVVAGERNGWVQRSGLVELLTNPLPGSALPEGLACFGTEPFWHLLVRSGEVEMSGPFEPSEVYAIRDVQAGDGVRGIAGLWLENDTGDSGHLLIQDRLCSDGMSDALHGRWVALYRAGRPVRTGCCGSRLPDLLPPD